MKKYKLTTKEMTTHNGCKWVAGDVMPCFNLSLADLKNEEWRDCVGFDGIYSISNYGRVRSERRYARNGKLIKSKIRKQNLSGLGNPYVKFSVDNVKTDHRILALVGAAFIGDKKNNEVYCHKNKIKHDNRAVNIIITTPSNSNHLNFVNGVNEDWGIGDMSKNQREMLLKQTDIYENGILKRKICTCCNRELDITSFYMRHKGQEYRNECKECKLKHEGVVDVGKKKDRIELAKAGLRYCVACKELKNLDTDFSKSKGAFMGRQHTCKACEKINNANYRNKSKLAKQAMKILD